MSDHQTIGCLNAVAYLPAIFWEGYVMTRLWSWFVEPLGAPHIGVAHAAGLAMVVHFAIVEYGGAVYRGIREEAFDEAQKTKRASQMLEVKAVGPAIFLGIGWILHWWMVRP